MNGKSDVLTSEVLMAFEDIAKTLDVELNSQTIIALALALVENKEALLAWLEAQDP